MANDGDFEMNFSMMMIEANVMHVVNMYDNNSQSRHHKNCVEVQVHNWQMSVDLHMLVQHEFLIDEKERCKRSDFTMEMI